MPAVRRGGGPRLAVLIVAVLIVVVLAGGCLGRSPSTDAPAATPTPAGSRTAPRTYGPDILGGKVVVLDPGHNGGNAAASATIDRLVDAGGVRKECDAVGAETDDGYPEHAFTFDVAVRVAAMLERRGAQVVMTRVDDRGIGPCINERARIGNDARADAAVSIHADGGPPDGVGFHVIAPGRSPDGGNAAILAPSSRLANDLRAEFGRETGEPTANYTAFAGLAVRDDLGGLNLSRIPKVFVECANMRDRADAAKVTDPAWRQRAAAGIADGLTDYLASGR